MLQRISTTENYKTQPTLYLEGEITYGGYKGWTVKNLKLHQKSAYHNFINNYEGDIDSEVYNFNGKLSKEYKLQQALHLVEGLNKLDVECRTILLKKIRFKKSDLFFLNDKTGLLEMK